MLSLLLGISSGTRRQGRLLTRGALSLFTRVHLRTNRASKVNMFPETTQQIPGVGIFPCTIMITSSSAPTIQHLELYEKFEFVFPQGLPVYHPAAKPSSNMLNKIIRRVLTLYVIIITQNFSSKRYKNDPHTKRIKMNGG